MSLESCPSCGYAVSIITLRCRHCGGRLQAQLAVKTGALHAFLAGNNYSIAKRVFWIGCAAVAGFLVYYIFTH